MTPQKLAAIPCDDSPMRVFSYLKELVPTKMLELVVERFPETVDIRLGATVIRQERNPNFRAHRPYEDKAARRVSRRNGG